MTTRTAWRKSSRSSGNGSSNCVEVAALRDETQEAAARAFQVRDSKLGDGSPVFDMSAPDFAALLRCGGQD
jgi:hypothetical protein